LLAIDGAAALVILTLTTEDAANEIQKIFMCNVGHAAHAGDHQPAAGPDY
jgi:hypothetical protein